MKTYYVIYVSYATESWGRDELVDLREKAIANNQKDSITGALLYLKGKFIQVLEGEETTVKRLLKKIKSNRAHRDLLVLLDGFIQERNFPEWHMGFRVLSPEEMEDSKELIELVENVSIPASQNRHPAAILLNKFFAKNM